MTRRRAVSRRAIARAFTLIELLIVLLIIAILLAILLPALRSARMQSSLIACTANVRSQAGAVATYAVDSGDALPPNIMWWTRSDGNGGFDSEPWLINRFLADYVGEVFPPAPEFRTPTGAWRCPDLPVERDHERFTHEGILHQAPMPGSSTPST